MIPYEQMPENNEDLASLSVSFPFLEPNTPEKCPVSIEDLLDYLSVESEEGITADDLEFIRTAKVAKENYWIWRFIDSYGDECFAWVRDRRWGSTVTSFDKNHYHLTPEQYMLANYHEIF
jgi:hypothetical protein